MANGGEDWSVKDFLGHFTKEIDRAVETRFKTKFAELAAELELLDSEFMRESRGCAKELGPMLDQLHSLSGRLGYCERPRGYETECDQLYGDVDKAISTIKNFRTTCTT